MMTLVRLAVPPVGSIVKVPLVEHMGTTETGREFVRILLNEAQDGVPRTTRIVYRDPQEDYYRGELIGNG